MILQEILIEECDDMDLYFRINGASLKEGNVLVLFRNAVFTTNTYYNSLSIGKWKKYCHMDKLQLIMTMQGEVIVTVTQSFFEKENKLENRVILSQTVSIPEKKELMIDLPNISDGTIYFSIKSLSNRTHFYEAKYVAACAREREISIALNICTFRREEFLLKNLNLLKKNFIENKESSLYGHLKIFVTDNGRTLDIDRLATSDIHICYNPNVGGSGGFSRGLLEIAKRKESEHITNAIFMDDDIEILPEALLRTYRMLKILKDEYEGAFLAGAMLRQDYKYIQFENAARWNGGKVYSFNQGLDLREYKNVVYNEIENNSEYSAWWYCCIPARIINADNLAIPVFLHMDDIEYSLRNTDKIITLNGIAVFHPVNWQRVESSNVYYDFRNMLIIDVKYYPTYGKHAIKRELLHRMMDAYFHYRYKDVKLLYKAVEDFHKGPDWLMQLDAAAYHLKIKEEGYPFEDVSDTVGREISFYVQDDNLIVDYFGKKKRRWTVKKIIKLAIIVITLNGAYLPSKKKKAFGMNVTPARLFRHREIILFDKNSMQGINLNRNVLKIFELLQLYMKACVTINKKYDLNQKKYEQAWDELHGQKYWYRIIQKDSI